MIAIGTGACGAGVATVLSSEPGPDGSAGVAACTAAQDCNADPAISSLRGQCVGGKCVCNSGVQTAANGKCGNSIPDGGTTNDCVAKGGVCLLVEGAPGPTDRRLAGPGEGTCAGKETCWVPVLTSPGPACTADSGCNDDPTISSQVGTCTLGICVCRQGAYVQPSGKCGFAAPPDVCPAPARCRQTGCLAGEMPSYSIKACNSFVEEVCCMQASACRAPVDFTCCSKTTPSSPICVSGWKTCLPDQTPTALPGTCN